MARFAFCSGFYASSALSADAQTCLNLYPEASEGGQGKSGMILLAAPGLKTFATLPDSPHRGSVEINGRAFCISGNTLYEIFTDGTYSVRGLVLNDSKPASMVASSTQLMIASGGSAYCYTLATNVLSAAVAGLSGAVQVGYSDGYFTALIANTAQIFVSNLLDGTTWNLTNTAIVSVFPGNVVSLIIDHREMCLLGNRQSVCYYDSGNVFPFDVIPGGFMEQGAAATFGASKIDNTYVWWGADERGNGVAWRANGYTPVRISTHAIENEIRGYSTISDAESWTYQFNGHMFWVTTFPTADKTWVYDVATQQWHQLSYFSNGVHHAYLGRNHIFAFGKHLVGDRQSGSIYQIDASTHDYAGSARKWVRRAPYITQESRWLPFSSFEVEADFGVGLQSGQGSDPQMFLRWSNDGANTWVNADSPRSLGKVGVYATRAIWRRLGRCWGTKGRVFELSGSDPVPTRIVDAYVLGDGLPPADRLGAKLREQA